MHCGSWVLWRLGGPLMSLTTTTILSCDASATCAVPGRKCIPANQSTAVPSLAANVIGILGSTTAVTELTGAVTACSLDPLECKCSAALHRIRHLILQFPHKRSRLHRIQTSGTTRSKSRHSAVRRRTVHECDVNNDRRAVTAGGCTNDRLACHVTTIHAFGVAPENSNGFPLQWSGHQGVHFVSLCGGARRGHCSP